MATVGPISRHLERAEAVVRFRLITTHGILGVYLHWLGMAANEACPLFGHDRMDDALDSINTRLTASSVGSGRLGVKCSRSKAWALDK
ncbi:hypothetical protein TNCV_1289831 [Trichonephila clavipes]|nr:hypothetical protein TNCV_1289831 [Trichonephila clavipes]